MTKPSWLPKSVRVLHLTYTIEPYKPEELSGYDGLCEFSEQRIRINPALPASVLFETLLHEIAHAVNGVANLKDGEFEEDHVARATPLWLCVWRDNPPLLSLLNRYATGKL